MKKLIAIITLFLSLQVVMAHPGGHGQKNTSQNDRTWHYIDKSVAAKGTFLLTKNGKVFIETNNKVVTIETEKLLWTDRNFVERHQEHIDEVNAFDNNAQLAHNLAKSTSPYGYWGLTFVLGLIMFLIANFIPKKSVKKVVAPLSLCLMIFSAISCGSSDDDTISPSTSGELVSATSNPATMKLAFDPYSTVSTNWDDNYFYVASNGIPEHQMMVGITAWIAQVPIPQQYTGSNAWSIPLNTKYAETPIAIEGQFQRGAIGIAVNGIPIFNPINASGVVSNDIGELDPFGGHSGRGDDYHYHTAPTHLESTSGNKPIAYALDGYAVYGSTEPDGSSMQTLDSYHGHEYTDGSYHYHGTDTYPYMIGAMRGEVTLEGDAPQSQVTPQPHADPPRSGDPHPINGDNLIITDLVANSNEMGYVLSYTIGGVAGSVDYSWDANDLFTFIFNDVNGSTTTETFQR
jgi:hypothetical protein